MSFISILLFSISVTFDGLIIGLSYGARKVKINFLNNILVGVISCLGTMIGMYIGQLFDMFIVGSVTRYLGSGLLLLFGCYMLYQAVSKHINAIKKNNSIVNDAADLAETFDINHSKTIEISEAVLLGLFLCINNLGLGIGASLAGLNIMMTSITCLILSVVFIEIGVRLTYNYLSEKAVQYSEYLASIIIIGLAFYEFFF
ncbi:MAG: manganese efflux pump [Turicibacter sp.]